MGEEEADTYLNQRLSGVQLATATEAKKNLVTNLDLDALRGAKEALGRVSVPGMTAEERAYLTQRLDVIIQAIAAQQVNQPRVI